MVNSKFLSSKLITNTRLLYLNIAGQRHLISRKCCRRAMLYVPCDDQKKIDKALAYKVDCIAFDCEDGVAQNQKSVAQETIHHLLNERNVTKTDPEWCVKVNSVQTGDIFLSDMDAIFSAKQLPPAIALPKVESCENLEMFSEQVWKKLAARAESDRGPINLLIFIESAKALVSLAEICKKAVDLATMVPIVPSALIIEHNNLIASLGATRTNFGIEFLYARQKLVLVAKAFGLQAIDIINHNPKGEEELVKECHEGLTMGYTGKQVIHPLQVPIIQELFTPSRAKIKWAKSIIKAFQANQEMGKGDFVHNGKMIDMPSLKQAENVIKAAIAGGASDKEISDPEFLNFTYK